MNAGLDFSDCFEELFQYDVISFDIFNTLLMRKVVEPSDIFIKLGQEMSQLEMLPEGIDPVHFSILRMEVEKSQKKSKNKDVSIYDIYRAFSDIFSFDIEKTVELELEMEKRNTYLNPILYDLIKKLHVEGKRIILISDMYFSQKQIEQLLDYAGMDLSLVEEIFVSSDWDVNKRDGRLFERVRDEKKLDVKRWIHIGDDFVADVLGSERAFIHPYRYNIFQKIPLAIKFEKNGFGGGIPSLYSLRLIMNERINVSDKKDNFWYKQGALIWGPVLTAYGEYVLSMAQKNAVSQIYFMMREGVLLRKVVNEAQKNRNTDFLLSYLYVSRSTTILARKKYFDRDVFDRIAMDQDMTVEMVFHVLRIQDFIGPYKKDRGKEILKMSGREMDELYRYLAREDIRVRIEDRIRYERNELFGYLRETIRLDSDFILCDIGWSGTHSQAIQSVLHEKMKKEPKAITYFVWANTQSVNRMMDGNGLITGLLKEWNSGGFSLSQYSRYLEMQFMDETGSVIGYDASNSYRPILKETGISSSQLEWFKDFQQGVLDFQNLFYQCKRDTEWNDFLEEDICKIVKRLFLSPTKEEAQNYFELEFEENLMDIGIQLANLPNEINKCKKMSPEVYLSCADGKEVSWPQGIVSLYNPAYHYIRSIEDDDFRRNYIMPIYNLCVELIKNNIKQVLVYGAGFAGQIFSELAAICEIDVVCFIDQDPYKWGLEFYNGETICSLKDAKNNKCKEVVIASFDWLDEMRQAIRNEMPDATIYQIR